MQKDAAATLGALLHPLTTDLLVLQVVENQVERVVDLVESAIEVFNKVRDPEGDGADRRHEHP